MSKFDVAVIGGGPGGYVAAIRAAQLGANVVLIEKGRLGGVCTNSGCIPSKTMIRIAEILSSIPFAQKFGIELETGKIDAARLAAERETIVKKLSNGIAALLQHNGVTTIFGTASLKPENWIAVKNSGGESQSVSAGSIIIATGSSTAMPELFRKSRNCITGEEFLVSDRLPKSALIVGGGPEGVEASCMLINMGCDVTIVEQLDHLLPFEDNEISEMLEQKLKGQGVNILTKTKVEAVSDEPQSTNVKLSNGTTIAVEKVIVCAGRKPNTPGLGLENAGVKTDGHGRICVNDTMETSAKGIYAIGDITGGRYAHEAMEHGVVAAENAMKQKASMKGQVIPRCTYSLPEVASVGITEEEAKKGHSIIVGKFSMKASGRALTRGETTGLVKVIIDRKTRKLLGVHMLAENASDMIGEATLAVKYLDADKVIQTIHPHPTLSESLKEAILDAYGRPLNSIGKTRLQLKRKQ